MKSIDQAMQALIDELAALKKGISELEKVERNTRQALGDSGGGSNRLVSQMIGIPEVTFAIFDRKLDFINDQFAELVDVSPEEACSSIFDPLTLIAPESRCSLLWGAA